MNVSINDMKRDNYIRYVSYFLCVMNLGESFLDHFLRGSRNHFRSMEKGFSRPYSCSGMRPHEITWFIKSSSVAGRSPTDFLGDAAGFRDIVTTHLYTITPIWIKCPKVAAALSPCLGWRSRLTSPHQWSHHSPNLKTTEKLLIHKY